MRLQVIHCVDLPSSTPTRRPPADAAAADVDRVRRLLGDLRGAMPHRPAHDVHRRLPRETEEEFAALLEFMEEVRFDRVGVFAYSQETGTAAAEMPDQVPAEVVAERYERAMVLQQGISLARNEEQVGRTLRVLLEGSGEGLTVGRSYRDAPEIDGLVLIPEEREPQGFADVRITSAQEYDLVGEIV